MDLFVKKWNDSNDFQISKKSLYDWMKKTKTGNVEKLVDKRGGYNRGQTTIPEKYSKLFDSLYLQQTKPTIESCFREVQLQANINGDFLPGIKAFRNYVKNMDQADKAVYNFVNPCIYYIFNTGIIQLCKRFFSTIYRRFHLG